MKQTLPRNWNCDVCLTIKLLFTTLQRCQNRDNKLKGSKRQMKNSKTKSMILIIIGAILIIYAIINSISNFGSEVLELSAQTTKR